MRIATLITTLTAIPLLVAGCSHSTGGQSHSTQSTTATTSNTRSNTSSSAPATPGTSASGTRTTAANTQPAPPPGVPIAEAIAWVEAGAPANTADYHIALRAGVTVELNDDVAFTTPAGTACMTDAKHGAPALACLIDLTNPPPRPADTYGQWKGGWVDFDGGTIEVGSAHGDPGRFSNGQGPALPIGTTLSFGDYRCRTDTAVLICLNYARHSAVRLAAGGVDTYACAQEVTPPAGIGVRFVC